MSVQAITAAFAVQGVSPSEKLLLLALANYADADGECWPSQTTLTFDTGLSERTIRTALASLEASGLLSRQRRNRPNGSRTSDLITLTLPETIAARPDQPTGKSRQAYRQMSPDLPANVAPLTTLEPSENRQRIDAVERASASDWPEGNPAAVLVDEIASPWLDPQKTPGLILTAGRVSSWRREGASWSDDVLPVVKAVCSRRKAAVGSWQFFDAAISQSIANNRAGLSIPEARAGPESLSDRIQAERDEAKRLAFARMDAQQHG